MPPLPQRRNCAYINRPNYRDCSRWLRLSALGTATWTGLAIDLDGLPAAFPTSDFGVAYLDEPRTSIAPLDRRAMTLLFVLKICAF